MKSRGRRTRMEGRGSRVETRRKIGRFARNDESHGPCLHPLSSILYPLSSILLPVVLALVPAHGDKVEFPAPYHPANSRLPAGAFDTRALPPPPTKVRGGEPITLVVRITSLIPGPLAHPPQRDKLQLFPPGFDKNFFVEGAPEADRVL